MASSSVRGKGRNNQYVESRKRGSCDRKVSLRSLRDVNGVIGREDTSVRLPRPDTSKGSYKSQRSSEESLDLLENGHLELTYDWMIYYRAWTFSPINSLQSGTAVERFQQVSKIIDHSLATKTVYVLASFVLVYNP